MDGVESGVGHGQPVEAGEADVDEGLHRLLQPSLPGEGEGLLVACSHLGWGRALLEPVVADDEQSLDAAADIVFCHVR